jgi:hypothetical protein
MLDQAIAQLKKAEGLNPRYASNDIAKLTQTAGTIVAIENAKTLANIADSLKIIAGKLPNANQVKAQTEAPTGLAPTIAKSGGKSKKGDKS